MLSSPRLKVPRSLDKKSLTKEKSRTVSHSAATVTRLWRLWLQTPNKFVIPGLVQNLSHNHLPGVPGLLSYSNSTVREVSSKTKIITIVIIIIFLQHAV